MKARIYTPSKSTMQSGRGKVGRWVLEYDAKTDRNPDALMGWSGASNTLGQVRLPFPTLGAAKEYAEKEGLEYTVSQTGVRKVRPRNYGDNFKYIPQESAK